MSQDRTEQATPKRMKEAREKGSIGSSKDLTAWLSVGAAALMLPATVGAAGDLAVSSLFGLRSVTLSPETADAPAALDAIIGGLLGVLGPLFAAVVAGIAVGVALQGGMHFKKVAPQFQQFDALKGLKRIFGTQALWEGAKALLKTAVVGIALWTVLQGLMPTLLGSGALTVSAVLEAASQGIVSLLVAAVVAGLALAGLDVLVVMRRNRKHTRMTKQEVKDENKNTEGDPLVRAQRRSRQLAMTRNRMISSVATADVVLVNPTHVAVALKYEAGKSAPRVVAKGAGTVATRIRERAMESGVPLVKDIPLARALHAGCEVGHEIPPDLYAAVAKVLAFVFALEKRSFSRGPTLGAAPITIV